VYRQEVMQRKLNGEACRSAVAKPQRRVHP
jgi:hypothetical protein